MRSKRKKHRRRKPYVRFLIVLFFIFNIGLGLHLFSSNDGIGLPTAFAGWPQSKEDIIQSSFEKDTISSSNVYLMSRTDKQELLNIHGNKKLYPASMTKIMTILLGVENLQDENRKVHLPTNFVQLTTRSASMAGFSPGEEVTVQDLFYGAMLPSGADACLGIAKAVSGSEHAFVDKMNRKAQEIGMTHTHFSNSDGLHDKNHYSTAKDIACLLDYALDNKRFYKIFTTRNYQTEPNSEHPQGLTFTSTLFGKIDHTDFDGGKLLGGKTGYTGEAGLCLASLGKKHHRRYILVTGGAPGTNHTQPYHIEDALNIYGNYLI